MFPERPHLFLLGLQRDELSALTRLQVEHALSGLADGAGREAIRPLEVEVIATHVIIVATAPGRLRPWVGRPVGTRGAAWVRLLVLRLASFQAQAGEIVAE